MKLPGLLGSIILTHEVFVLNDLRMDQVLGDTEFSVHFLETLVRQFLIVVNFSELVYKLTFNLLDLDLENLGLGSYSQLFLHGNIQNIEWLLQRPMENLCA
jgi:hypothetical protein